MAMFYDYGNNRNENGNLIYNYAYLKTDLTYEADRINNIKQLGHGGMLGGAIEGHRYEVEENGVRKDNISLSDLYADFIDKE